MREIHLGRPSGGPFLVVRENGYLSGLITKQSTRRFSRAEQRASASLLLFSGPA